MRTSSSKHHKKQPQLNCRAPIRELCCSSCRLSVSSFSEEAESSGISERIRYSSISTIAHAMVQEKLEQMIRERKENEAASARMDRRRRKNKGIADDRAQATGTKFVVMFAMEKCSYDPSGDFRESMAEMIMAKRIKEPKDLRSLLNYYVSMNSDEYHAIILEAFHQVCSDLFLCTCH